MAYKLLSSIVKEETINTEVEYTFKDGSKKTISVPHFMPKTKEDVISGIENREKSEQARLDAKANNEIIKAEIDKEISG